MMKNLFVVAGVILMMSFAFAAAEGIHEQGTGLENPELKAEVQGTGQGLMADGEGSEIMAQERMGGQGDMSGNGAQVRIMTEANNQVRLENGGQGAKSSLAIGQEMVNGQLRLSANLSNGRKVEIKVMPDSASETALARLRLRVCSEENNCTLELKEVDAGEGARLAYAVKAQRQSKFLGLFNADMDVEARVDAETGEVLGVKKPWWAFLASESEE